MKYFANPNPNYFVQQKKNYRKMFFVGVGIRKNRYKNCSIRIYRRTFREMSEMSDQEKLEDSVSSHSSVLSDSNSEESIRGMIGLGGKTLYIQLFYTQLYESNVRYKQA